MDTSLEKISLTEECTLNEFVIQAWIKNVYGDSLQSSRNIVGYHHTRSVPILVPVRGR